MLSAKQSTLHEPDASKTTAQHRNTFALSQLYFYLTQGCNLRCRHCWLAPQFDEDGTRHPTLPVELFETAVREAKPLGLTGVKLTGGEPLLHPQFLDLLGIVRQEQLSLNIETNGFLCTPQVAAEIAGCPQRSVSVSLDGVDGQTHDWVRGVAGSFEQAKQAVQNLVAAGTPPQIIMSVMRCNADQVDAMVRLAESLGAYSVKFNIVQPIARGEAILGRDDALRVKELIELGRHVERNLVPSTSLRVVFDLPLAFRPLSRLSAGDGCSVCGIHSILGVIPTGHYALCGIGEHIPELVFGQIGGDPLEDLWQNTSVLDELRAGLPGRLEGVCSRCLMRGLCLGSCIAESYYRTGSLWAPFWFCKEAEEEGLFPPSRLATAA